MRTKKIKNHETPRIEAPAASEAQDATIEIKLQDSANTVVDNGSQSKGSKKQPDPTNDEAAAPESAFSGQDKAIGDTVTYLPVGDLKPHPLNEAIYGCDIDEDLVCSIATSGVYNPILITSQKIIVAGHRRHAAAKQVGLDTVPTVQFYTDDEIEIKAALVEANKQRVKTNEMIGREYNVLKDVEEARAKKRMEAGQPVAQGDKGKARDKTAAKIGKISGFSAEHAGAVVNVIEKLAGGEKTKDKAEQLRLMLNKNIAKAHKVAVGEGHIKVVRKNDSKKAGAPKKSGKANASHAGGNGANDDGFECGLQFAWDAETFLKNCSELTVAQKKNWKSVMENMVKLLAGLGVKVSVRR